MSGTLTGARGPGVALQGALFFSRRSLVRVIHSLREIFGMRVRVGSRGLGSRGFCKSFEGRRALCSVLGVVTRDGGLHCIISGGGVMVSEG